ncbi:MAG: histidine kinase [Pyrinomonadaceae bacterium]|nr:histidine kinase [Pyrinomonadaceae bacterium]
MDLITHSVLIVAALCFALGAINLRLWFGQRERLDLLAMVFVCFFGVVYSLFEAAWLKTESPVIFGQIARWSQIASWGSIVSLAVFLHLHLRAGRKWLLGSLIVLRTIGLAINFAMPVNIQFLEMTAVEQVTILGEQLSYPIGVPNPWHAIQALTLILLLAYSLDALISVWRRGEHRKALIFGGGVALLSLTSLAMAAAIIWFSVRLPPFASPAFLFVVVGMAFEFDYDLRRSAKLAGELTDRERELTETLERLNLSASAGHVGIWSRELGTDSLWVSQKMRELFEFDAEETVTVSSYMGKVHPDDRRTLEQIQNTAIASDEVYEAEYRVMLRNGEIRWIRSMGQARLQENGEKLFRGASVDITRRKLAEAEAHDLSHRLMDAQEKERARLARELHDDLSQSLALLSIQLQSLTGNSNSPETIRNQVDKLTDQIQKLSSDVHRISHELHPSKLTQLGLESALRGFCREATAAHGLKIGFNAVNVPKAPPNDIALCFYRIAQEAVQNTVKHSGASMLNVELAVERNVLSLLISDNGNGFDPNSVRGKESLGLISMQERIRGVGGKISIMSVIGSGTRIEANVELPAAITADPGPPSTASA